MERLAGIAQYDEELGRAEAKRTDLEGNLGRIQTLLGEIRSHLTALESQRLQAIQYRQLQDQKRQAEARLARAGHLLARQEVSSCEAQLAKLSGDLAKLREEAQKLADEQGELTSSIEKIEQEIARKGGAEAAKFKQELDDRRMAFARLDENVRTAVEEIEALTLRSKTLTEGVAAETKEAGALEAKETELASRLGEIERNARAQSEELKAATAQTDHSTGRLAQARKEILKVEQDQRAAQQRWERCVAEREEAKAVAAGLERDLAQANDDRRTRELELHDLELRVKEAGGEGGARQKSSSDLQKELFQAKAKEKTLREASERLRLEVLELNRRYMALDARLKVRSERGGGSAGLAAVDFLLSQRNLGKIEGIRGTVQELARFDAEHATALTIAAGSRFQSLVVETDQVAEQCIKLLRSEKRGRATFLPLNRMLSGRPKGKSLVAAQSEGAVGFALDLVKFDEALRPAFWYVFGETVVMDDLTAARGQMGGVRLVTLQGDLIEATGAISGGYIDAAKGAGADSASDLKRLGEELRERTGAEGESQAALTTCTERVRLLSEELAKRSGQAEAQGQAQDVLRRELAAAQERLKESRARIGALEITQQKTEKALTDAEASCAELRRRIEELKQRHDALQQEYLGQLPAALSRKIQGLHESSQAVNEERLAVSGELESVRASRAAATKALEARR
ncbi:MAG TPA: hypothetical protein VGS18_04175, partial [Thermoplasmata archaeon]|nr:hypothetical protein [Thermoplasmata archaeon]